MASRDCSTELHTHRGQCWEPGQSERLCEVFTWCRSASDAEKRQEHVYLYTLLKVMDVQCLGFVGAALGFTHNLYRRMLIYIGLSLKPSIAHLTTQMKVFFFYS